MSFMPAENIYTVSRLNRDVRFLLESQFPFVWVEGEISNFTAPRSGHWYFSLKDADAQIRCALFRPQQRGFTLTPKDGQHVLAKARVSLYEGRGDFQLIVEEMEDIGEGQLRKAFEVLKKTLDAEGYFDSARKKPIPALPRCIGVITSPTGAAIRDILNVLKRRFSAVPIIIYPTLVQGHTAAGAIANAVDTANRRKDCDVLLLTRGGGSLEDLWPFNERIVADAIFHSEIPIISGIGHEVDFTIADFVADLRAPTPSAAAELAVPDQNTLLNTLAHREAHCIRLMMQHFQQLKQQLAWMEKQIHQQHPLRRLHDLMQKLDMYDGRLTRTMTTTFQKYQQHVIALATRLDTLSPLATLKRGFAIASRDNGTIVNQAHAVRVGDSLTLRFIDGLVRCHVTHTSEL